MHLPFTAAGSSSLIPLTTVRESCNFLSLFFLIILCLSCITGDISAYEFKIQGITLYIHGKISSIVPKGAALVQRDDFNLSYSQKSLGSIQKALGGSQWDQFSLLPPSFAWGSTRLMRQSFCREPLTVRKARLSPGLPAPSCIIHLKLMIIS